VGVFTVIDKPCSTDVLKSRRTTLSPYRTRSLVRGHFIVFPSPGRVKIRLVGLLDEPTFLEEHRYSELSLTHHHTHPLLRGCAATTLPWASTIGYGLRRDTCKDI
jgi:hypothetical protein